MLKKQHGSLSLNILILMLINLVYLVGCGDSKIGKAHEFIEAKMYEQAIVVLNEEILSNPKNAEAHFLLGECKLITGQYNEAEESFKRATALNPDLGMKIGEAAISAAQTKLPTETTTLV